MKKYKVSIFLLCLSIMCMIAFNIIGSEVAADGMLIEPFFLILVAYLLVFISLICFIFQWILNNRRRQS